MFQKLITFCLVVTLVGLPLLAQTEKIDDAVNLKIRQEALKNSSVMNTVHKLTDVYGSRLTGTPGLKASQAWALTELKKYGLENVRLEDWDFHFPGWANERLESHVIAPFKEPLICEVMAWTPSTNGAVRADAYQMTPPDAPTEEELNKYLAGVKTSVKGKIVLTGRHNLPTINFKPSPLRLSDEEAKAIYAPRPAGTPRPIANPTVKKLSALEVSDAVDKFLKANGALIRVYDAREPYGVIRAVINRTREASDYLPTIVMRNEDYGRITRVMADGIAVKLEFNIVNRLFPEGATQQNLFADIAGSDKKQELVMLGAHIDSHHLATGATDNAAGVAVMMEAMRILKVIGITPRRTIRIALWSGEEQGVLGSQLYVLKTFGSAEKPLPDFDKLQAYFNLDTGTGKIRGMRVFGPAESGEVLRQILVPFADLGVAGAGTYSNRTRPGSDHAAFSVNGLPGVYIDQDPIEYGPFTWHTGLDTYERVIEEDTKQAAMVIASAVYHLAMREERFPRFTKENMPPLNYTFEPPHRAGRN